MHNIVERAAVIVEIKMPKKGSEKEHLVTSEVTNYVSQPDITECKSNEEVCKLQVQLFLEVLFLTVLFKHSLDIQSLHLYQYFNG